MGVAKPEASVQTIQNIKNRKPIKNKLDCLNSKK